MVALIWDRSQPFVFISISKYTIGIEKNKFSSSNLSCLLSIWQVIQICTDLYLLQILDMNTNFYISVCGVTGLGLWPDPMVKVTTDLLILIWECWKVGKFLWSITEKKFFYIAGNGEKINPKKLDLYFFTNCGCKTLWHAIVQAMSGCRSPCSCSSSNYW